MHARALCAVCLETFPLSECAILKCGHCFCRDSCLSKLKARRGTSHCPQCRAPIGPSDGFPIHINFSDGTSSQSDVALNDQELRALDSLTEDVDDLDTDSTVRDMERVAREFDRVAARVFKTQGLSDIVLGLFEAVKAFKNRFIPVFRQIQTQSAELETLRNSLSSAQASLSAANNLTSELRAEKRDLERVIEMATNIAEALQVKYKNENEEKERLRSLLEEKEVENKKYKGLLTKRIQTVGSQRVTIAGLEEEIRFLKNQLDAEDGDDLGSRCGGDSLVVMPEDYSWSTDFQLPQDIASSVGRESENQPPSSHPVAQVVSEACTGRAFGSDWQLPSRLGSKKIQQPRFPKKGSAVKLDAKGHVLGAVQLGSRLRMGR